MSPLRRTPMLLALFLALAVNLPARADVPNTLAFQGVLTDAAGHIVADGSYSLSFSLYTSASGCAAIWTELHPSVAVASGSFSAVLGGTTPLALPFDVPYYLGITLGANPEMAPRMPLAAAPYALSLRLPFSGTVSNPNGYGLSVTNSNPSALGDVHGDRTINVGPSASSSIVQMYGTPSHSVFPHFSFNADSATSNVAVIARSGATGGSVALLTASNTTTTLSLAEGSFYHAQMSSGDGGAVKPTLGLFVTNGPSAIIDLAQTGDAAVQLPAGSIGPAEMSGLPGIAQTAFHSTVNYVIVPGYGGGIGDIVSVTITTPYAGYVTVDAVGTTQISGAANANCNITYQIDEGTGTFDSEARTAGVNALQVSAAMAWPLSAMRTYYKAAGTYTFHLRAATTGAGVYGAEIDAPIIRAVFCPVSYGSVVTVASGPDAASIPGATPVAAGPAGGAEYRVDLRELEQRAAAAQTEADRASAALAHARAAAAQQRAVAGDAVGVAARAAAEHR